MVDGYILMVDPTKESEWTMIKYYGASNNGRFSSCQHFHYCMIPVLHDPVCLKAICGLLSQLLTDEKQFAVNIPELLP